MFKREDYSFELPAERIAQTPSERRDYARLMVAKENQPPRHSRFDNIGSFLSTGDVLVINQTRVINARCFAVKESGGRIQVFILGLNHPPEAQPVMLRPAKRAKPGTRLQFPNAGVSASITAHHADGTASVDFGSFEDLQAVLEKDGELPLPPYIRRENGPAPADQERYQTVFASEPGAVAAPTAGLHFTRPLLTRLEEAGVQVVRITHHVGIGTFKPLDAEDIRQHKMEAEQYQLSPEAAEALNRAKAEGRRIIAVGTTSTRCLESNFDGSFTPGEESTNLYIYPGYQFKAIDGLITNFHLPGSTLILLVSALVGRDRIMELYRAAIGEGYRFYSYGDAMLLLPERHKKTRSHA